MTTTLPRPTLPRRPVVVAPVPSDAGRPAPRQARARAAEVLVGLVPAVVLLVLGAVQLSRGLGFWYDEDYTVLTTQTPLSQLVASVWTTEPLVSWLTVAPSFNAPYYVVVHGWSALFGTSPLALRTPSLLCACAAVGVLARAVRLLSDRRTGLVAGLLTATGPLFAQQAVEARPYGMAELATALTVLLLVRRREGRGSRWGVALAAAAAGLLHWFTLPVVVGLAVVSLARRRSRGDGLALLAACLPAAVLVAVQVLGTGDGTPLAEQPGWGLAVRAVEQWSISAWWLSAALAVAFLLGAGGRARGVVVGWVVVPLALVTLAGLVRPLWFDRYGLFTLMGLAAGAALGCRRLGRRTGAVAAAALVAVSLTACLTQLRTQPRERQDLVVAYLEQQQTAGQPVAAGDGRAALQLVEQVALTRSRLQTDLVLRPAHVSGDSSGGGVAWVVRSGQAAAVEPSPNDAYLAAGGWRLDRTVDLTGDAGSLIVQRWVR